MNDQLIAIDEIDLLNKSNSEAMRLIGQTMQRIGPTAMSIRLDILRAVSATQENQFESHRSSHLNTILSNADEGESLYLDILRKNASRQSSSNATATVSTVPRVTIVGKRYLSSRCAGIKRRVRRNIIVPCLFSSLPF